MEKIIEAKDVYFSYQSEDEEVVEPINVLNGVSLDII